MAKHNTEEIEIIDIEDIKRARAAKQNGSQEDDNSVNNTVTGCFRGALCLIISVIFSVIGGIAVWTKSGFFMGLFAGLVLFIICAALSIYVMYTAKRLTVFDCFFPVVMGALSCLLFFPFDILSFSFFSVATCMSASVFLSMMLLLYRAKFINGYLLIVPFLVFMYELLPFEFPSDIDNFLAFGGDGINAVWAYISYKMKPHISLSEFTGDKLTHGDK